MDLPYNLSIEDFKTLAQDIHIFYNNLMQVDLMGEILNKTLLSSILSEFIVCALPTYNTSLQKNNYHNGHPDIIPTNTNTSLLGLQRHVEGVEVKCSGARSFQAHSASSNYFLFVGYDYKPFALNRIVLVNLDESDWTTCERKEGSRRTPTANLNSEGRKKLEAGTLFLKGAWSK